MQVNSHDGWDDAFDGTNIFGEPLRSDDTIDRIVGLVKTMPPAIRRSNEDGMGGNVNGQAISRRETFTEYVSKAAVLDLIEGMRHE